MRRTSAEEVVKFVDVVWESTDGEYTTDIQQLVLDPVLNSMIREFKDVCTSDCQCVYTEPIELSEREIATYWRRFTVLPLEADESDEDRRILTLETFKKPCNVGFKHDETHRCPLLVLDDSKKPTLGPWQRSQVIPHEVFVFTNSGSKLIKFGTLPNVFCAQADKRWWHDHRTPGGIMITSNALGHFEFFRNAEGTVGEREKTHALDNAMRTITNAHGNNKKIRGLAHCPATCLVPLAEDETTPIGESSDLHKYSPSHYEEFVHNDHLVPSVFFSKERDPKDLTLYDNLSLQYIYDAVADPDDHRELMTGTEATWYDVKRNIDRLPAFVDPEQTGLLRNSERGRLVRWLETRLKDRLVP